MEKANNETTGKKSVVTQKVKSVTVEVGPATYTEEVWTGHGRGPLTCTTVESSAPTMQIAYSKSRRVLHQDSTLSYTIPQALSFRLRSPGFPQFHKFVTMDIDDILREVDPVIDTIPSETRDLQALTRAWVAERCAPELLECATLPKEQTTWCSPSRIRSNASCRLDGPPTAFSSA